MRAVIVLVLCLTGCATARPQLGFDELWIPKLGQVIPAGAIADRVAMDTECVGVSDVRHLPDGWSIQGIFEGENFHLVLTLSYSAEWQARLTPADAAALNESLSALRVVLKWRGQWSDCAYWRLSVQAHDIALP